MCIMGIAVLLTMVRLIHGARSALANFSIIASRDIILWVCLYGLHVSLILNNSENSHKR